MAKVKPDNTKHGCFSDFFQVLCAGYGKSPLMHPYVTELEQVNPNKDANAIMVNAAKLGVVARLMGLGSFPNTNLVSKGSTSDLVPRSRSVNSVDYMLKFDASQGNNKQLKTSTSFREVPTLFQHKSHDFLVLHWDSGREDHKVGSNLRKQGIGLGELRQRKKQGSKYKEIAREKSIVTENKKICSQLRQLATPLGKKLKNEDMIVSIKHSSRVQNHNEVKVLASASVCSKNCSNRKGVTGSSSTLPNM